eukprot:645750-Prymnesium_polylepis.1
MDHEQHDECTADCGEYDPRVSLPFDLQHRKADELGSGEQVEHDAKLCPQARRDEKGAERRAEAYEPSGGAPAVDHLHRDLARERAAHRGYERVEPHHNDGRGSEGRVREASSLRHEQVPTQKAIG